MHYQLHWNFFSNCFCGLTEALAQNILFRHNSICVSALRYLLYLIKMGVYCKFKYTACPLLCIQLYKNTLANYIPDWDGSTSKLIARLVYYSKKIFNKKIIISYSLRFENVMVRSDAIQKSCWFDCRHAIQWRVMCHIIMNLQPIIFCWPYKIWQKQQFLT